MQAHFLFHHTNGYRAQRFRCPLLFPQATGESYDHAQFAKGKGCVKDVNWEVGGQMRVTLGIVTGRSIRPSIICKGQEDGRMGKKTRRGRDESQEEQTGTQCPHASLVSAGLQDVLGMTQWRKEHPKATWQEIEAAVDERINQMRSQLIEYIMQMSDSEYWRQK